MTASPAFHLDGARILVTRPRHQAGPLVDMIEQAGGLAPVFPALAIGAKPLSDREQQLIRQLSQVDVAFFISPNAVNYGLDATEALVGQLPGQLLLACVGAGSEQALMDRGYQHVIRPDNTFTSEGLLSRSEFSDMHGKQALIFRGNGGRELLRETLEQRGAQVDYIECYQRMLPEEDPETLNRMIADKALDAVVVTSSDALRNLVTMTVTHNLPQLKQLPVIVVSPRMAEVAGELGFGQVYTADRATDDAILATLNTWRKQAVQA
ncbi:MAG: uroporphyrinogen-III synthase [Gammaproteobacteria bacterium]|nr:uroporphyrinogen-III synthase [Gammaproteobacteria bacterium]